MQLTSLFRGIVSPGSACLVAAVPEEWIESIPAPEPLTGRIAGDILLKEGYNWLKVVLVSRNRPFKEENNRDNAGLSWQQNISGKTCGHNAALHQALERWINHRWVLLYKEVGTLATYLVGRPGSGALMAVQYSNEKVTQSTVSFSRASLSRAFLYEGSFTLDNDVTVTGTTGGTAIQKVLASVFYRHAGAETTTITISALVGKQIIGISRSGIADVEVIADAAPLTDNTVCHFNIATGGIDVSTDYPINNNETIFALYQ